MAQTTDRRITGPGRQERGETMRSGVLRPQTKSSQKQKYVSLATNVGGIAAPYSWTDRRRTISRILASLPES